MAGAGMEALKPVQGRTGATKRAKCKTIIINTVVFLLGAEAAEQGEGVTVTAPGNA